MAIDQKHDIARCLLDADVAGSAGETLGVVQEPDIVMLDRDLLYQLDRAVGRLAVNHQNLKKLGVVILTQKLAQRVLDEFGFIADRDDNGDFQRSHERRGK